MSWFSIQELEYLLRIILAAVCGGGHRLRAGAALQERGHPHSHHCGPIRRADDGGVQVRLF